MPYWEQVLTAIGEAIPEHGVNAFDVVRRQYLARLQAETQRDTILYAANWINSKVQSKLSGSTSISIEDIHGLMAVMPNLKTRQLDLILHSPGGNAGAAEAIVDYLRQKFDHIRVIIPHAAMSAATMVACGADVIVMGNHSFIGPIDPQFQMLTRAGYQSVAAQAILDEFELAKKESTTPSSATAWASIIGQYPPGLTAQCKDELMLAEELVGDWLNEYMLVDDPEKAVKSKSIAKWLAEHHNFHTHGRYISRTTAQAHGLLIDSLEDAHGDLQDLVLSVFHAAMLTLSVCPYPKIIENHLGTFYVTPDPLSEQTVYSEAAEQPTVSPDIQPDALEQSGSELSLR